MAPTRRGAAVDVEEIIAAAKAQRQDNPNTRPARRSAIYRWMWDNFDLLKPEFDSPVMFGAQRWQAIAVQLDARGYSAGLGTTPTGETVRKTWWKVSRARAEWEKNGGVRRPGGRASRPDEALGVAMGEAMPPPAPPARSAQALPVRVNDEEKPRSGFTFENAKPRGWNPKGQGS